MKRFVRRGVIVLAICATLLLTAYAPVWGSIFGEENATLVQIVVQLLQAQKELSEINRAAHETAAMANDMVSTYQKLHAGYEELRDYTWDSFLYDVKADLYHQYPGFAELEYASKRLEAWEVTRTTSPFTAYQAISAVAGDVGALLEEDIANERANVDEELILRGEAAGGFAAAHTAEQATRDYDEELQRLYNQYRRDASPGTSQQVSARASLMIASQNSYIIRLLSRAVRLDGVDMALESGARLAGKNQAREAAEGFGTLAEEALTPPRMMTFDDIDLE